MTDSLARAREWLNANKDGHGDICLCHSCMEVVSKSLASLLDTAVREARVEEAEWWAKRDSKMQGTHWDGCEKQHEACARLRYLKEGQP